MIILYPNGADCTAATIGSSWRRRLRRLLPRGSWPRRAEPADIAPNPASGPRDRSKAAGGDHDPSPTPQATLTPEPQWVDPAQRTTT
jgi:hypothetical protein